MSTLNPEFIERYQIMLQQDPNSRVFAPLAEAYRRMGMLDEALELCVQGVQRHPSFPGGRISLARILIDKEDFDKAGEQLKVATELSPENIMAQQLLADCLVKTKRPKDALKAFKMILFLNPSDDKARKMVARLESLTADEYEEEVFKMEKLSPAPGKSFLQRKSADTPKDPIILQRTMERYLSLADAFVARNDPDKAMETLLSTEDRLGPHPEIERRKNFIQARARTQLDLERAIVVAREEKAQKNKRVVANLERILNRIQTRRQDQ